MGCGLCQGLLKRSRSLLKTQGGLATSCGPCGQHPAPKDKTKQMGPAESGELSTSSATVAPPLLSSSSFSTSLPSSPLLLFCTLLTCVPLHSLFSVFTLVPYAIFHFLYTRTPFFILLLAPLLQRARASVHRHTFVPTFTCI